MIDSKSKRDEEFKLKVKGLGGLGMAMLVCQLIHYFSLS